MNRSDWLALIVSVVMAILPGRVGTQFSMVATGGGSSYVEPRATRVKMWQGWKNATGDGLVVLSWSTR